MQNAKINQKRERLVAIRDTIFDGSTGKMADSLQYSNVTLSMLLNGRRSIALTIIDLLAEHLPQINMDWFITGRGNMLIDYDNDLRAQEANDQYGETKRLQSEIEDVSKRLKDAQETALCLKDTIMLMKEKYEKQ